MILARCASTVLMEMSISSAMIGSPSRATHALEATSRSRLGEGREALGRGFFAAARPAPGVGVPAPDAFARELHDLAVVRTASR